MLQAMLEAHGIEQLFSAPAKFRGVSLFSRQRGNEHIFQHGALRKKMMELEDETDLLIAIRSGILLVELRNVAPSNENVAAVCPIEGTDYV